MAINGSFIENVRYIDETGDLLKNRPFSECHSIFHLPLDLKGTFYLLMMHLINE